MEEKDLPKKVTELVEEGCPQCLTWDHLADVHSEIVLKYHDVNEAKEKGLAEYPNAIFLKAAFRTGSSTAETRRLKEYIFVE